MTFTEYSQLEERAEAAGIGDDRALAQLLHILQFKEVVKSSHKRTMHELHVWEKNIAKSVESRIKEAEAANDAD